MEYSDILKIGTSINIQRTGGRIHRALIAGINCENRSATVEWSEIGQIKGKEIDIDIILSLNPQLGVNIKSDGSDIEEPPIFQQPSNSTAQSMSNLSTNEYVRLLRSNRATISNSNTSHVVAPENLIPLAFKETTILPTVKAIAADKRRSVVTEVEKLKQSRQERRQRQVNEKGEKEALMKLALKNPHWELFNMILECRRGLDIQLLTEYDDIENDMITVCVRKRPLNQKEIARKEVDVITIPSKNQLIVHEPKTKVDLTRYLENQLFRFDYAFDETSSNELVYRYTAQPLVKTIFEGGFATCFAYGQTGSGKTHTMGGDFIGKSQDYQKGIYAMSTTDVFRLANSAQYKSLNLIVSTSFFEIYSGNVFDLLNNKAKLRMLEDGKQVVQIVGLTEKVVLTVDEVLKHIQKGNQARTSGQTAANTNSSRSHAIFQLIVRQSNSGKIHGQFSLIDLAGNERGADTTSENRQTRIEGAEINKSLLVLKECIRALGRKGAHLPFRGSKLTQVLRDSFVGPSSRTCMIAMISPSVASCEHSLNTLRYAYRVKELGCGDLNKNRGGENGKPEEDLQSYSENEMTAEMLNFHQVVSELQAAKDTTLDNHKNTLEQLEIAVRQSEALLKLTDDVTYDHEAYCKSWEDILDNTIASLLAAKELVTDYKAKMAAEEQLSHKTKHK